MTFLGVYCHLVALKKKIVRWIVSLANGHFEHLGLDSFYVGFWTQSSTFSLPVPYPQSLQCPIHVTSKSPGTFQISWVWIGGVLLHLGITELESALIFIGQVRTHDHFLILDSNTRPFFTHTEQNSEMGWHSVFRFHHLTDGNIILPGGSY